MKFCLSTVTSGYFQHFLPLLTYTVRVNIPHIYVRTFHRGRLDSLTLEAFEIIHKAGITATLPIEDRLLDYPDNDYTTNCVRFLVPQSYFDDCEYVYMTDADMIYLSHEPPIDAYYISKLKIWGQCFWGRRGPRRDRKTKEIDKRISGGGVLWNQDWYKVTEKQRAIENEKLTKGELGKIREDDERMLWDIVAGSGMECPTALMCSRPKKYKEIHLGDFKNCFTRWKKKSNMRKRICKGNFYKFFRLEEDKVWQKLVAVCCRDKNVNEVFINLRDYMIKRKSGEFNKRDISDMAP